MNRTFVLLLTLAVCSSATAEDSAPLPPPPGTSVTVTTVGFADYCPGYPNNLSGGFSLVPGTYTRSEIAFSFDVALDDPEAVCEDLRDARDPNACVFKSPGTLEIRDANGNWTFRFRFESIALWPKYPYLDVRGCAKSLTSPTLFSDSFED